ncbi:hypothetical protein [uncultured Pseudokineococcus sp.]|uniref:hypothetical protein n=1 Tax=uncultured Pseudokineococcus sp. TaxID=1642928 RepID=UPI002633F697|nr:hypothetical protein [uncultured Pseudokineococcus sp.]
MAETSPTLVMRVFTRGLKIPTLIGKLQGGVRIWGGPYTTTQVYGAIAIVVVGFIYGDLLLPFGWVGNRVTVAAIALGVGYLLGLVRVGGRDPVSAALALVAVMSGPTAGRYGGRPVRLPRPGRARQRIQLQAGPSSAPAAEAPPAPAGETQPATTSATTPSQPALTVPAAPAAAGRSLSGLEQRLAVSTATSSRS